MRHISAVLLLLASTAVSASAQSFAPHNAPRPVALRALPHEASHQPAVVDHTRLPAHPDEPKPQRSRQSRVLRAAAVGAVIGFAVGGIGGSQIATGCDAGDADCSTSTKRRNMILSVGGVGAGLGAILGAGVGAVRR